MKAKRRDRGHWARSVLLAAVLIGGGSGCIRVKSDPVRVEPIRVEPIHIIVDVNVKVERELDNFFGDIDNPAAAAAQPAAEPKK